MKVMITRPIHREIQNTSEKQQMGAIVVSFSFSFFGAGFEAWDQPAIARPSRYWSLEELRGLWSL